MTEAAAAMATQDRYRHEHRWDLTPEMVGADDLFEKRPADLYAELLRAYPRTFVKRLWAEAGATVGEAWRPVEGYEGLYEVSDWGRVRSFVLRQSGAILKPRVDGHGYLIVTLPHGGALVSRLVAAAFIGPSSGLHVAHYDGNPQHNRPCNLRWATRQENEADKVRHGTRLYGERVPNARLTDEQALDIYRRAVAGEPHSAIAADHGIGSPYVSMIFHGTVWAPVTGATPEAARQIRAARAVTHCLRGHAFDEANTYVKPNGSRACRACMRNRDTKRRMGKVAA